MLCEICKYDIKIIHACWFGFSSHLYVHLSVRHSFLSISATAALAFHELISNKNLIAKQRDDNFLPDN